LCASQLMASCCYYLAAGCLALTNLIVWGMVRGRFGLRLMAIRGDEQTAREVGVRVFPVVAKCPALR
jgi:ABC-type branched-subunit amino acid transport system permease subunit